jgi:hypothetical protein
MFEFFKGMMFGFFGLFTVVSFISASLGYKEAMLSESRKCKVNTRLKTLSIGYKLGCYLGGKPND